MAAVSAPSTIGCPQAARAAASALPWTSLTLSVTQASQTCSASSMVRPSGCAGAWYPGRRPPGTSRAGGPGSSEAGKDAPGVVVWLTAHPIGVHQVPEARRLRRTAPSGRPPR